MECPCCGDYGGTSITALLRHVRLFHADKRTFGVRCNLGCGREKPFTSFYTWRDHVYAFHNRQTLSVESQPDPDAEESASSHADLADTDGVGNDSDEGSMSNETTPEHTATEIAAALKRAAATFILSVQETHRLPQTTMDAIVREVDSLYQVALTTLHSSVKEVLGTASLPDEIASGIDNIFDPIGPHGKLFSGLESNYLQTKYYKESFGLVEPTTVVLGTVRKQKGAGVKRRCVEINETMQYVPILETLKVLLQNETVLGEVHNNHCNKDSYLEDYCDGDNYRSHPLFAIRKDSLQLFFYYDDVEICNPLGSKRTVHKLGLFYFSLGNVSPTYRSRLSNIQLVAVVESRYLKKYGMNAVLSPFIEDVAKLEEGYEIAVHGSPQRVFGTIATISADNLAANALGGFKEGSTAHRGCRQCMALREDISSKFLEEELQLRTMETHKQHCTDLNGDSYDHYSKEYGINHQSALMDLEYFDMCNGSLVPDVMHDVLEGVLQRETKLVLLHCISTKKYFRLSYLTQVMESFEFGYMEIAARPTPIARKTLHSGDYSLQQNASQMWLLGRILPAMVGHLVPEDDSHWENLILLLQIMDHLLAPKITRDEAVYLQDLIEQHHETFSCLYPDISITPKFHYMVHMPRIITEFGPLIRHWTMRFEARHRYFGLPSGQLHQCVLHFGTTASTTEVLPEP